MLKGSRRRESLPTSASGCWLLPPCLVERFLEVLQGLLAPAGAAKHLSASDLRRVKRFVYGGSSRSLRRTVRPIVNKLRWLIVLASLVHGWHAAGNEVETLTNEHILELTEAGVAGAVIVAKIAASAADFDVSTETLIELTEAGVEDAVLEAMARKSMLRRARPINYDGTPCEAPGVYLAEEGTLVAIDASRVQRRTRRGVFSTAARLVPFVGMVVEPSRKARAIVRGTSAELRTGQSKPTFWFCFLPVEVAPSGLPMDTVDPSNFWVVSLAVHRQKDERSLDLGKLDIWAADSSGPPPEQVRDARYERVKPHVFRVTATAPLEPGEYGFYVGEAGFLGAHLGVVGTKLFAFGVD